jgi:4-hydroxybutyrate CoA-transferase
LSADGAACPTLFHYADVCYSYLQEKNDLGLHSEICPTGMPQLIAAGNVNGVRKTLNRCKAVCTALWGDEFGLDLAHLNPAIELHRMRYTNNARIIARHDNMVAINSALGIDRTIGRR